MKFDLILNSGEYLETYDIGNCKKSEISEKLQAIIKEISLPEYGFIPTLGNFHYVPTLPQNYGMNFSGHELNFNGY